MYNPEGSDNNKEFIEIYSDDYTNLTDFIIEDISNEDVLSLVYYYNSNYFLIVESDFDYSNINASIYTVGSTIGNDLNNDNDVVIFRNDDGEIIDVVVYDSEWGGDGNKSLERISFNESSNDESNWAESRYAEGTPGRENSIIIKDFSSIAITEFLPDPAGDDDMAMPDGEWVELYNSANDNIDLSDLYFLDDFGHEIRIDDTHAMDTTTIEANDFLIIYTNGFSGFLNNDEDRIGLYYLNDLIDEVSYSSSREDVSWAKINNWVLSEPSPGSINENISTLLDSSVKIISIYLGSNNKAEFGDNINIRIQVDKGDTTKNSIKAWVEKDKIRVSKQSVVNVYGKFINYTLTIPVQLDPNCNGKFKDGEYKLILDGLDSSDFKYFQVEGIGTSLCETVLKNQERTIGSRELNIQLLEVQAEMNMDEDAMVKVKIDNNSSEQSNVELWSYIYNGPVSLSGDREGNKRVVSLPEKSSTIVELRNSLEGHIEEGDYKIKANVRKQNRKTPDEFVSSIRILDKNTFSGNAPNPGNLISGGTIYESSDTKAKNSISYILIITLLIIIIFILFRKGL